MDEARVREIVQQELIKVMEPVAGAVVEMLAGLEIPFLGSSLLEAGATLFAAPEDPASEQ